MDHLCLRSILLNVEHRLSNDDRKRLHFYLGNDVPRRIRDDPTLSGTLSLMEFLFDQDKISNRDCSYLINAFDEIQCFDAVNLLKEHLNRNQAEGLNQSIQSLSLILPPTSRFAAIVSDEDYDDDEEEEEEDRQAGELFSIREQNISGENNIMLNSNTTNINQDQVSNRKVLSSSSNRKHVFRKYLLPFVLLSVIIYIPFIFFGVRNNIKIYQLETKLTNFMKITQQTQTNLTNVMEIVQQTKTNHTQTIELSKQLQNLSAKIDAQKAKSKSKKKWKQSGMTVAGGKGRGSDTNRLFLPFGIFIDDDEIMYIADHWNHRIIQWKHGEQRGRVIAGVNGIGNGTNQLFYPTDVVVEKRNDTLIIADYGNKRVLRWSIQNKTEPQVLVPKIDCFGLSIGKDGSIYISNHMEDEVRRWKEGEKQGELVAGGKGKGNGLNQFNKPRYIFVDDDYSVYVPDSFNHRVMKWVKGATEGIVVAGGNGKGNSSSHLSDPEAVVVDQSGQIYVADCGNHRVMRWSEGNAEGETIVGGNGKGSELYQLQFPTDLAFDAQENLYVVDYSNDRVQRFEKDVD